jgi:TATA-box binding protein (TBP) (component of TFIID and TFIIIB)
MLAKPKTVIDVTNYVASAEISGFDIKEVLKKIPESKFRPNGFPATVISAKDAVINLYDSGKMSSTKNKTHNKAIESLMEFTKRLQTNKIKHTITSYPKISMISAVVNYHRTIDIKALRRSVYFKKDIQSFPAIQMSFPNGVAVKAYAEKLVITAQKISMMAPAINEIKKYIVGDII